MTIEGEMSDDQLAVVRARCDAATPGPWVVRIEPPTEHGFRRIARGNAPKNAPDLEVVCGATDADLAFMAHARDDVPRLLDEIHLLKSRRSESQGRDLGISSLELAAVRARADAATPGPWIASVEGRDHDSGSTCILRGSPPDYADDLEFLGATVPDVDFIACARQDIPMLLNQIDRLRSRLLAPEI